MRTNLTVAEYVREDGSNPFKSWFDNLDTQAAVKIATAITRLEAGNPSSLKSIGSISECRIDWGPGYRIYLGRDGVSFVILLGGGTKRGQDRDIERAKRHWAEYKARKSTTVRRKSKG